MERRVRAHEEGRWVREAAAAYAAKHREPKRGEPRHREPGGGHQASPAGAAA